MSVDQSACGMSGGNGRRLVTGIVAMTTMVLLGGCATTDSDGARMRDALQKSFGAYNSLIRWRHLEDACTTYADEPVRQPCLDRAATLKDLNITDVTSKSVVFGVNGTSATVRTEIEYYLLPSNRVRTILDVQQWEYRDIPHTKERAWVITTLLPDFGTH